MPRLRIRTPLLATLGLSAALAPSAHAIVGGTAVPEGKRDYVAYISINGAFACTGTLAAPTVVVTAGHCSSVTGAVSGTPIGLPGQTIRVTLGSIRPGEPGTRGEEVTPTEVIVPPDYFGGNGLIVNERNTGESNDVALLRLPAPSKFAPVRIAAKGERDLWQPGTPAQIAGFGVTESGGDAPDTMQETEVPIVADETARRAYPDSFENVSQIGAGLPQGGRDTCQGDSGGPLIVPAPGGGLRLVGDTSYGQGCAEPNTPGIYGRVADDKLREFIRSKAPEAIAPEPGAGSAPGAGTAPGSALPGGAAVPAPGVAPLSAALDSRRLRRALSSGVRLRVRTPRKSSVRGTLRFGGTTVARGTLRQVTGRRTFAVRFTPAGKRALKARRRAVLTLSVVATGADGRDQVVTRRITLKR